MEYDFDAAVGEEDVLYVAGVVTLAEVVAADEGLQLLSRYNDL